MAAVVVDNVSLGNVAFCNKDYVKAAECYTHALGSNVKTQNVEVLKKRCHCFYETSQYPATLKDAKLCIQKDPGGLFGYIMSGKALGKMKEFESALEIYKKGLEIDSKNVTLIENLKHLQDDIIAMYEDKGGNSEGTYSAVKMSSFEPYPGDDELEKLETEILKKWNVLEFPSISVKGSNPKLAEQEAYRAKEMLKAGNNEEVKKRAVAAVEQDMANLTLWAEMADLLHKVGDLKRALQFLGVIPAEFRSGDVWKLGGKLLAELGIPVTAEHWLKQAIKRNKDDEESPLLFQNIRVKRLYDPLIGDAAIGIEFTQYGRALTAKKVVKAGQIIFQDKPAILSQTLDTMDIPACSHCAKCLMRPENYFEPELLSADKELKEAVKKYWPVREIVYCSHCDKEKYCSEKCRNESWERYHKMICISENKHAEALYRVCDEYKILTSHNKKAWTGVWNASFSPMVMARIWGNIICEANRLAEATGNLKPTRAQWVLAQAPYRRFIAYGSSSNAKVIPKMLQIMQDMFGNLEDGKKYNITEREFDGRYFQATCNVQAFSDPNPPFRVFIESVAKNRKLQRIVSLCSEEPEEATFAGMFPLHACLNHSCINNVEIMDGMVNGLPGVSVRTRSEVKPGDELFSTYINTSMPRRERRAWLYRAYNFWCLCPRCEFEGDGPTSCTHCSKTAESKERFPACGKCHKAWYCSTRCQKAAWKKGHKRICSAPHSDTTSPTDKYIMP